MSPRARNRWLSLGYALADGSTLAIIFWLLFGQPRWLGMAVLTLAFLHRVAGVMQVERRLADALAERDDLDLQLSLYRRRMPRDQ